MAKKVEKERLSWNEISLVFIIVSNICFYTIDMINLYRVLTLSGIAISVINNFRYFNFKIQKSNCVVWLIAIYSIFFFYGFFFLQAGTFAWDSMLTRFGENIAIYLAIKGLFYERGENILRPFVVSGILSFFYLAVKEFAIIIGGGIRIGSTMSGNANTVGFNFGFFSLLVAWDYCKTKKKQNLILLVGFIVIMLLTGSKKAVIIIILDLFMIIIYEKKKVSMWLKMMLICAFGVYAIFNIPYLYDIIGIRIESMIVTMFSNSSNIARFYSYSTSMRELMIREAFALFLSKPIFGGGYNYFFANTSTLYDYSHCNYTELLCSFGVVGTLIFYSKYFSNMTYIIRNKIHRSPFYFNIGIVGMFLTFEMLIVDWATVTFSGQCMGYIPIMFTSAALDYVRSDINTRGSNAQQKINK